MWAIYLKKKLVIECEVHEDDDFTWMFEAGYFLIL